MRGYPVYYITFFCVIIYVVTGKVYHLQLHYTQHVYVIVLRRCIPSMDGLWDTFPPEYITSCRAQHNNKSMVVLCI